MLRFIGNNKHMQQDLFNADNYEQQLPNIDSSDININEYFNDDKHILHHHRPKPFPQPELYPVPQPGLHDKPHHPPHPHPNGHHPHHPPHKPHKPHHPAAIKPLVSESTKVAEIRDVAGNLRYKVVMTNYNDPLKVEEHLYCQSFKVEVIYCFYKDNPIVVAHRPRAGEPRIFDYDVANAIYEHYKKQYTALIKSETHDIQDIYFYKDKIDYKRVECCACCIYCKKNKTPDGYIVGYSGKAVCTNPYLMTTDDPMFVSSKIVDTCEILYRHVNPEYHYLHKHHHYIDLHPRVDLDGICKYYKGSDNRIHDVDGMNLVDIVYNKLNDKVDTYIDTLSATSEVAINEISSQVDSIISSTMEITKVEIFNDVTEKIDEKIQEGLILDGDDSTEEYGD